MPYSPESGQRADKANGRSVMLDLLEQQDSLTINQWKIFTACLFSIVIDFFDFALIGFVLAFFVKDWHLTFGQSGAILFASGVAAIPGGIAATPEANRIAPD